MLANILDKNIARVLSLFLISPGSRYTRKEIKEKTLMNNLPLDKTLKELLNLGIIQYEKNLLILNQEYEHKGVLESLKKEFNYFNLPLHIYIILIEITSKIIEIKNIKEIYLFGSYSKLVYHDKSDIDIAVIFSDKILDKNIVEKNINKKIERISKKYGKKIEIHFFLERDIKEDDPLIKDILKNGKKIL